MPCQLLQDATLIKNEFLYLWHSSADGRRASEGCTDIEWWVCTQGSCAGILGPAGPGEVLLMHTSLMLKEMNVGLCGVARAHRAGGNLHLCQLSHVYTQKKRKNVILFAFHHNILSPYGQPSSWHGATVKCVPPTAHSYSASHHHLQK